MSRIILAAAVIVAALLAAPARADTLLVERVQREAAIPMPVRGMGMDAVLARFGEPVERLEPRGGQKNDWPVIRRWVYPTFTVYFERSRVIDAVANRIGPNEVGPKPPIR